MKEFLDILTFAAVLGSGLVAGIFFAFSTFVMRALGRLPENQGITAMQAINVTVLNPWFFLAFFGTGAVCLAVAFLAFRSAAGTYRAYLLAACALYLLGCLLVTVAFNVPLNNRLAAAEPDSMGAEALWAHYLSRWTLWNQRQDRRVTGRGWSLRHGPPWQTHWRLSPARSVSKSYAAWTVLGRRKQADEPTRQKPLRLWPGVVAVALQWLAFFVVPIVAPGQMPAYIPPLGGLLGVLAVVVWWAFFSRAPRSERWGAVVLMIVAMAATSPILHESVATGNMGFQFVLNATPVLSLAFVVWAVAARRLADRPRRAAMVATILLACGAWTLVRSASITGDGAAEFAWRWAETPEERLLAQPDDETTPLPPVPATPVVPSAPSDPLTPAAPETATDWPGFLGPDRDGIIPGVRIETDWSRSPPVELWRRPIGPRVSSFAVRGDLLYTQEQRGDHEVVACYNVTTGDPVWRHRDTARFWDSHVGAGPRATPALSDGRVYTFGATGILNALDAADGAVVWSRNAASDTDANPPYWGFVSSPLVVDDFVIVHTDALVAYDLATGDPRWFGPPGGGSYSSPHRLKLDGIEQILLLSDAGGISVAPADGTLLWEHP